MAKKFLKTLMLFCLMQNSLQLEHLLTIMEEFNFNHPYLIGSFDDITLELIKLLSKDGHYLNVQPKVNEFSLNEKVTSNAIIFVNSTNISYFNISTRLFPLQSLYSKLFSCRDFYECSIIPRLVITAWVYKLMKAEFVYL